MASATRRRVFMRVGIIAVAVMGLALVLSLSSLSLAAKEVRIIIAEGRPDSENAAYNFADFEKATGIKVYMETGPYNTFFQKATTDLVTGQGRYDVIWFTNPAGFGPYLMDLKPLWDKLPASEKDDFFPLTVSAMYTADGKMVGIPWKFPVQAFYYRTDLFREAGIVPPRTIDEWRSIERKLTTGDMFGGGIAGAMYWGTGSKFYGLAAAFVAPSVQENPWVDSKGNFTLNAPWNVEALEWLVDGFRKYKVYPPETPELQHYDVGRRFMSGVIATQYEWMWLYTQAQDPSTSKVVGKVGVATLPVGPGGRRVGYASAQGFGINAASKHKEEAWELIKWLTSKQALINTMKYFTWESPRKSSWEIPEVDPKVAKAVVEMGTNMKTPAFVHKDATAINELVAKYIQQALMGILTPKEALDKAQAEVARFK